MITMNEWIMSDGEPFVSDNLTLSFCGRRRYHGCRCAGPAGKGALTSTSTTIATFSERAPAWQAPDCPCEGDEGHGCAKAGSPLREHSGRFGRWGMDLHQQWSCCLCETSHGAPPRDGGNGVERGCERTRPRYGPRGMTTSDDAHLVWDAKSGRDGAQDLGGQGRTKDAWREKGANLDRRRMGNPAADRSAKCHGTAWSILRGGGGSGVSGGEISIELHSSARPRTANARLMEREGMNASITASRQGGAAAAERAAVYARGGSIRSAVPRPGSAPCAGSFISLQNIARARAGWERKYSGLVGEANIRGQARRLRSAMTGCVSVYSRGCVGACKL